MNNTRHRLILSTILHRKGFRFVLDEEYNPSGMLAYFDCGNGTGLACHVALDTINNKHAMYMRYADKKLIGFRNGYGIPQEFVTKVTGLQELTLSEAKTQFNWLLNKCKQEV